MLDPGRGRTKTGQLFAYARDDRPWGGQGPPGVAYLYAPDRKGVTIVRHLDGSVGTLQVDGYSSNDGDRQMVSILTAVLSDGLGPVEAACSEALREGVHSADVVLNILARQREHVAPVMIMTPDALRLRHPPVADCARLTTA